MAKSEAAMEMEEKIALGVEAALTIFSMYDIEDCRKFVARLKERRNLKSKALFAGANAKSGKSYKQAVAALSENTAALKDLIGKDEPPAQEEWSD